MAGITDAEFLNSVISEGFDAVTLGGYSLDVPTIEASKKIIERGRKEFYYPPDEIFIHIENEVASIKKQHPDVLVSANVRATTPFPLFKAGNIKNLDILEINCHCRQDEITAIGCGQQMLKRPNLFDFISTVARNTRSKISVKIRANVEGVNTLKTSKLIQKAGADFIHVDAMKPGCAEADWELLGRMVKELEIPIIGNNSVNSSQNLDKMLSTGVDSFSVGRAVIGGKLDFQI